MFIGSKGAEIGELSGGCEFSSGWLTGWPGWPGLMSSQGAASLLQDLVHGWHRATASGRRVAAKPPGQVGCMARSAAPSCVPVDAVGILGAATVVHGPFAAAAQSGWIGGGQVAHSKNCGGRG